MLTVLFSVAGDTFQEPQQDSTALFSFPLWLVFGNKNETAYAMSPCDNIRDINLGVSPH